MPQSLAETKHRINVRHVLGQAYNDILNNHTMAFAAGLSYYFVLSLFPLLIFASALLAYLPIHGLFDQILQAMSRVVPAQSMALVRKILTSVLQSGHGALLTFGIIGTLWTASSGFTAMIEALNVAYDVPDTRPWWRTRLLALFLVFVEGALTVVSLALVLVGPHFGNFLAAHTFLGPTFVHAWPYLRWGLSVGFMVLAIELLFYWAPNVKQRFWASLPGAAIGVGAWLLMSWGLGIYFRSFAHFNKTYGVLAGAICLMTWLYWSSFAILVGAEINSELLKAAGRGTLELKEKPPAAVTPRPAWEEHERPAA